MTMRTTGLLALTLSLSACGGLVREARMQQPAELPTGAVEVLGPPGAGQHGEFALDGGMLRFKRGSTASIWDLPLVTLSSGEAPLRIDWQRADGPSQAECLAKRSDFKIGGVHAEKPLRLHCQWDGDRAQLQLSEHGEVGYERRDGDYQSGDLRLRLRSVHQFEGSPMPSRKAIGYLMLIDGKPVGALDLAGHVPRLLRPDPASPTGRAVTEAALVLALLWEPHSN